nr:hypothetical protein [Tanacetum cinerariifolium]GEV75111.1 hypothetical protein [Tanacetum cinerariifolium]
MGGNTVKDMTTNFGKLDKFEGHDFRRWQKKMLFLLTTLKVVSVLTTPMPELLKDATVEAIRIRAKWENDDYICRGHILMVCLILFLMYIRILNRLRSCGIHLNPSTWLRILQDFKHTLKHGKDDLSLVQLSSHLHIEESLKAQDNDKGKSKEVGGPSVNMTKEGGKNKHHEQNKGKKRSNENNSGYGSNKKPKLECWKCGKTGHFKKDCRSGKKNNANAGGSEKGSKDQSQDQDSGATTHVCKDRCWFKTFKPMKDGFVLYMGDEHFAPVHGKGSEALEFSSGKTVTLFNVLYVPKLHSVYMSSSSTVVNNSLWHARLGHVHYKRMLEMYKDELIPAIDDYLFCYVYLLHAKDEALDKFRIYKTEVELQQNDLIKTLRTDRGGEYNDLVFFQSVGVILETTAPYTPQQNGVAERKNRALKEMVNSMLSYSGLSEGF